MLFGTKTIIADNITTLDEAKEVIKELVNNVAVLEAQLEELLFNLTSDNVKEIDFGITRYKNYEKTILKDYVKRDELNNL